MKKLVHTICFKPLNIAPLVSFRILFGVMMCIGALRFLASDWITTLYDTPTFFFKFYGFSWLNVPNTTIIYIVYLLIAITAFNIAIGFLYHWSAVLFFILFTYTELLDATNYLNHYYLVVLLAFWLIWVPANRRFSVDVLLKPSIRKNYVPAYAINIFKIQLCLVYFFAGFAKLNYDWLVRAMPLAIWLPERTNFPLLGKLFGFKATAYIFSYAGALYDLSIGVFLLAKKTRIWAYVAVVVFHVLTKCLFNIGLFPVIMICSTTIFFSAATHQRILAFIGYNNHVKNTESSTVSNEVRLSALSKRILPYAIGIYVLVQILLPLRHYLYKGNVLWTEEGYRFSWRVMLVEKSGVATFYITDADTGASSEIINSKYLTSYQEKQMAIQPDFILQFAKHIGKVYSKEYNILHPKVTVDAFVALNGRPSKRLIKKDVNLLNVHQNLCEKDWIIRY